MADTFSRAERSRIMAAVKSTNTAPELVVRRLAHSLGYRFRLHDPKLPGKPDLVFKRLRKVIFVHGCFWHMHDCGRCRIPATRRTFWLAKLERNAARDKKSVAALRRTGWGVMRIWECQLRKPGLRGRLLRFLSDGPAALANSKLAGRTVRESRRLL